MAQPMKLYQREDCPYCQMVRKKLDLLNQPVLLIPVEPDQKDRDELFHVSGQRSVPVLIDGEETLTDSQAILDHLDKHYGNGQPEHLPSSQYGISKTLKGDFSEIIEKTVGALKEEGFGVLTEINVKETLKKKLDVDVPKQVILGACNPGFAHKALDAEKDLGLLLPCNVVVREDDKGDTIVSAVNPLHLLSVVGRDDLLPVAAEVKAKLSHAITSLN